jgi:hypothetical protein
MKKLLSPVVCWMKKYPVNAILMSVACLYALNPDKQMHHFLVDGVKDSSVVRKNPVDKPNSAFTATTGTRPDCCCEKLAEVLAPATDAINTVKIDCNLTLKRGDTVTKRMIFQGGQSSNVTVNGNGAILYCGGEGTINYNEYMIEIKSKSYLESGIRYWTRPENITIKNLKVSGSVRVWGMGVNGQGSDYDDNGVLVNHYKNSSRTANHVATARKNAPKSIVFDNITVTSFGRIPLYVSPGVTGLELRNSELKGKSTSVAIYLDAETSGNTIKNNYIYTNTSRELIALDGSGYNKIINNKFSSLSHGGIYLYRNCGEGGVIRHSKPAYNQIINNIFYYDVYSGSNPAVHLGSRNGNRNYCDEDDGSPHGSSKSNLDYAQYNVVMQNQIYKRSVTDMIKTSPFPHIPGVNSPNYIAYNEKVTRETKRPAGCFVSNGYQKDFIVHGESIELFNNSKGEPVCTGYKYTANDGELIGKSSSTCRITKVNFDCQVSGNNNGCQKLVSCRSGQKIIGARAAANLESGSISFSELDDVKMNTLKIVRPSDHIWEGISFVGNTRLLIGEKTITGVNDLARVVVGCKERDDNGGDCHIKGMLYCYGSANTIIDLITAEPAAPVQANEMANRTTIAEKVVHEAEEKSKFDLVIFPNPSSHYFNVQIQGLNGKENANLRVFDSNGKVIEIINNISSGRVLTLGDRYPQGLYIIEAIQGTKRKIEKLIKQ